MLKVLLIPISLFFLVGSIGFYWASSDIEGGIGASLETLTNTSDFPAVLQNVSFQDFHVDSPWQISLRSIRAPFSLRDGNRFLSSPTMLLSAEAFSINCKEIPWKKCRFSVKELRIGLATDHAASSFTSAGEWERTRTDAGALAVKFFEMPFSIDQANPRKSAEEVALALFDLISGRGSSIPVQGEGSIQFRRDNGITKVPLKFMEKDKLFFIRIDEAQLGEELNFDENTRNRPELLKLLTENLVIAPVSLGIRGYADNEARRRKAMDMSFPAEAYAQVLRSYILTQEVGVGWSKEFSAALSPPGQTQDVMSAAEMNRVNTSIGIQLAEKRVSESNLPEVIRTSKEVCAKAPFVKYQVR